MTDQNTIQGQYRGKLGELFPLALTTALLTIVTLGIYRFWAKTRIRKYLWSSVIGDGDALEYTGTGLEKFLGFLVAIVVLAIYLGIIQTILVFLGMSYAFDPDTPEGIIALNMIIYVNFLALTPLIFYATYRAKRYRMARTRWRGVRFGMEKGAWGYALRAMGYYFLSGITLGLLLPLASFKLEKYMADRSWFGDAKFEQNGRWQGLYTAMKHIFIGLAILLGGAVLGVVLDTEGFALIGLVVGYTWLLVGGVYYRVHSMRYFWEHRTLGRDIFFDAEPRTGELVKIIILGSIMIGILVAVIGFVGGGALAVSAGTLSLAGQGAMILAAMIGIVGYVVLLVLIEALTLVFITQPTIEHYVTTFTLNNKQALDQISQRAAAQGVDGEGFADALDVGGAF